MNEERLERINELTLKLDLKINFLYSTLRNFYEGDLDWICVNHAFEEMYSLSKEVRRILGD